jgi:4,5-DOPA dioxygenase extradiol
MKMPALFIGHGSPTNAAEDNEFTKHLKYLGHILPKPKAIMVISAHWMTKGTFVSSSPAPEMIYDFFGFPDELYQIVYKCPGAPEVAKGISETSNGLVKDDNSYGLDHGSWTLLKFMYPDADIPVFELSVDMYITLEEHFEIGKKLAYLRDEGVLIIGSGNMVHNLRDINWEGRDASIFPWARKADEILTSNILAKNYKALSDPRTLGSEVNHAVPSFDHYIPMMNILGMQQNTDTLMFTHNSIQFGSISMRSFMISG